ncbi:unsaturated rhamnogalacturonyl hydrolase [Paenibacillus castaneae]|uniref:glycoside hydrolase family 88 protein n=1 Tax=Paenibacillus castaneae TaxID=474957 RepID=UPI000C9B55C0|nr:glycoside hydrolase family 88 protein [Paenibacillus castaneae]NIK78593.1 unsaturated rhamnogalacturonyl hydrolase [Paenibacillus castaneae]
MEMDAEIGVEMGMEMRSELKWSRLEEAARSVYSYMMHSRPDEWGGHQWSDWAMNREKWDWNPGVGIVAAVQFGLAIGDERILEETEDWISRNLAESGATKVINTMAPYAVFPMLYVETGKAFYKEKTREIAYWMVNEAPQTREGAFEHTVTENASFREQIWADTLFMAVLFLARAARLLNSRYLADEALKQVLIHLRALQDEHTGLVYHGWNCETADWMSGASWNRANAWIACGIPMILSEVESVSGGSDTLDEIKGRYLKLAMALAKCQHASGLWPTVLDYPDYYEETSGSAGIAYGLYLAVKQNLVPHTMKGHADQALEGLLRQINERGVVAGVSGGTPVLASLEAYNEVPVFPTLYGQGLTLLLLTEALGQQTRAGVQ